MLVPELRRAVRVHGLLEPGQPLLVAVSGGVDSMVLLHVLRAEGYPVTAAHADHGLRGGESLADHDHVRRYCDQWNIPFVTRSLPVLEAQVGSGRSVEMVARDLRYAWLNETAALAGLRAIAMAHHRNDAVETLLMHLLRGTGIAGWAGIPRRSGNVVRPLLSVGRDQIRAYASTHRVPFREDSSNADLAFLRNRVRHELLPLMERIRPGASRTMARSLDLFGDLVYEWTVRSAPLLAALPEDRIPFSALASSLAPRLLLHHRLRPLGFHPEQLEDLLRAALEGHTGAEFLSAGYRALVDREAILVMTVHPGVLPSYQIGSDLALPADAPVRLTRRSSATDDLDLGPGSVRFLFERLDFPLLLRPWQHGDRFKPHGMSGTRSVSDLLIDAKVPRHLKERTYVLCSKGAIAWVVGHRGANGFVAPRGAAPVVTGEVLSSASPDVLSSAS
ncbi:MAG: tRNA lysidine(34) synthetase TilS [Flavobacteriales bacterium]|nr:tRNA lysidine(34) synthetase TilS [Flavobacteriales bacterium]MBP6697480.1 tRNA lysidine(34) synthetase TilS [Flavobacteriales bacterium]